MVGLWGILSENVRVRHVGGFFGWRGNSNTEKTGNIKYDSY